MSLVTRAARRADRLPWRRYWIRRGGTYEAEGGGFLVEPGSIHQLLQARNANLSLLDDLDSVRCVIALGDPGLGKSRELESYASRVHERFRSVAAASGGRRDALLSFDLKDFDNRDSLLREVFQAPAFEAWKADAISVLYLVLDSLDESLIALAPLCEFLLDQLTGLPLRRLRLRIACRTAVLPPTFRVGLEVLYSSMANEAPDGVERAPIAEGAPSAGTTSEIDASGLAPERMPEETITERETLAVVEIVALTRADATIAAVAQLGSEDRARQFFAAVDAADAGHFAARPQTLVALIQRFRSGHSLAASQVQLFRDLAEHACDPEAIRPRSADTRPARTSRAERYRVAGRICAALMLGNRKAIALDPADVQNPGILDLRNLNGDERIGTALLRVDDGALADAVNTGLFTGREDTRLAPHQTFAEFLAADWITAREIPLAQLRPLLVDPLDPERKVVPQLRQLAAWLAAMRQDVFDDVARRQPDIVLWSDVVQVPVERRAALVEAMLHAATANTLDLPDAAVGERLRRLEYDGLADQLISVVRDSALPERTRDLALDIASACRLANVAGVAADLALDDQVTLGLRVAATRVVGAGGVDADRRRLIPLATGPLEFDVADELKGVALAACHKLLDPELLFHALTRPKRPNWGGSYGFALYEIERTLEARHVEAGCHWLSGEGRTTSAMQHVAMRVVLLALDRLSDETVRIALAGYVWDHLNQHDRFLNADDREYGDLRAVLSSEIEKRHQLVVAIVTHTPVGSHGLYWVGQDMPDLFLPADVPWALDQLTDLPQGSHFRGAWRDLLAERFDAGSRVHLEAAFAHRGDPDVAIVCSRLVEEYDSVDDALGAVRESRARHARELAENRGISTRRLRELPPLGPIQSLEMRLKAAVSAGRPIADRWRQVMIELHKAPDGSERFGRETVRELEVFADSDLSVQLAEAAQYYLENAEVSAQPFLDGQVTWSVIFGFHAAAALYYAAPERLWDLSATVWTTWARSFAGYSAVTDEEAIHAALLTVGETNAPEAMGGELLEVLDRYGRSDVRWLPNSTSDVATQIPAVVGALSQSLIEGDYSAAREEDLLGRLLVALPDEGQRVAAAILAEERSADDEPASSERRVGAAAALLLHVPDLVWEVLWPMLATDDAFSRSVFLRGARSHERYPKQAVTRLTSEQIGDLYVILVRLFPHEADVWHVGTYSPDARDNLEHWRDGLLRHLENAKTQSSVAALYRVASLAPERDYLVRIWLRASAALRGDRWRGVAPTELLAIADAGQLRLVESGSQLLDVIEESLTRLERDLQGELRSVVGLWDEQQSGGYRPKAESHLANEVARHLRQDLSARGVVIGRELILQVGVVGGAAGLRTDIDVAANASSGTDRAVQQVRAVIEVKGSWNPEVLTALHDQLVVQYLEPHTIRSGLYLVGDYMCTLWAQSRGKSRSVALGGRVVLSAELSRQAQAATNGIREVRARVLDTSLPAQTH